MVTLFKNGPMQIFSSAPYQECRSSIQEERKDYFENHFNMTEIKTGLGGGTKHPEIKGTDTWLDTGQDGTFIWI